MRAIDGYIIRIGDNYIGGIEEMEDSMRFRIYTVPFPEEAKRFRYFDESAPFWSLENAKSVARQVGGEVLRLTVKPEYETVEIF